MRVGFLGFGEAGFVISKALLKNGIGRVTAYDCNSDHPRLGELIQRRSAESGVRLLSSNAELVGATDVTLSVVTASSALAAAEQTAPHLRQDQIFCDCNSVSPSTKTRVAQAIQRADASFVEAAIMAPVHSDLKRVPFLMTGQHAVRLAAYLTQIGMKVEIMDGEIGTAAAVKMCRSIVIKGMEALVLECMTTAAHFDCEEEVLRSLDASNPEFHWRELSEYMMGRVLQHGVRRAAEMNEVAAMQREAGLPATMSSATAEMQGWRKRVSESSITTVPELVKALQPPGRTPDV